MKKHHVLLVIIMLVLGNYSNSFSLLSPCNSYDNEGKMLPSISYSNNFRFSIYIEPLKPGLYPSSKWSYRYFSDRKWTKEFPYTPAFMDISNDGKYLCAAEYSNIDEGWIDSITFYDSEGELLRKFNIGRGSEGSLDLHMFSENNRYYLVCRSDKITFFDFNSPDLLLWVWNGQLSQYGYWFPEVLDASISDSGQVLASFYASSDDLLLENRYWVIYTLFDKSGEVIWRGVTEAENLLPYRRSMYSKYECNTIEFDRDGKGFSVLIDMKNCKHKRFKIEDGNYITEIKEERK